MATRTKSAKDIFAEAIEEHAPSQWPDFLRDACGEDDSLRRRVEILLKAHAGEESLLDRPAIAPAATLDRSTEQIGCLIGPYKLLEQIGEGGMGVVYVAEQTEPVRRRVALKIIKPGMDTKQVIARFEAERQALAMMDHPNIARVLDAGTTDAGRPYFVMELVRGMPITEYCDQDRLSARQRLELFIAVCQAVQHAHQKGIIHRDLKPSNVMITLHDGKPVVKVIDFGVAKAIGQQLTDRTVYTALTQLVGTPLYMSPEQAELSGLDIDTRSDVYSLGVLLYELLTGTTPFDKERLKSAGFDEMRRIIREEEPETVSARIAKTRTDQPGVDAGGKLSRRAHAAFAELDWIVMKALEKDRSRRYESTSAFASDIQRYLSDEPVLACPPTTMYRFQKFARKHKASLTTAAAIAVCLILGTTVSAWQAARATTAEAQANVNACEAQDKAKEATEQRDEAQKQRDEVKALADKLAAKDQQMQRTLYNAHMSLAQRAWDLGRISRVVELLEQHHSKPGEIDRRGFEWHYLYKLCHPELLMLQGNDLAYSPDGKRMAIGTNDSVKILDSQTNRELLSLKGKVWDITFSPDSKHLAAAMREGNVKEGTVMVWDVQTGERLHAFKGPDKGVWNLAFSPDGKRLACAGFDKVIVRDSETGQEIWSIKWLVNIDQIAFSPDGKRLGICGRSLVSVWDAQTGKELIAFDQRSFRVGVAFSPDGKRLASISDGVPTFFDAQSGEELLTAKGSQAGNILTFSPDGKRLATASDKAVMVWDAQNGDELLRFIGPARGVRDLAFNPNGTKLAAAGRDDTVRLYDVATKQDASLFSGKDTGVSLWGFSPDRKRVIGSAFDAMTGENAIKLFDAQTGREVLSLKDPKGQVGKRYVSALIVSPDGKRLAAGFGTQEENKDVPYRFLKSLTGDVKVWDAQTGREIVTFKGHSGSVASVAFSPDSTRLASSSIPKNDSNLAHSNEPGEIKIWDAASGEEMLNLQGHKWYAKSIAYCPDGKRLASFSEDDSVKLWDAATGRELLSLPSRSQRWTSVAFSPDGKRLACSDNPSQIKVCNSETGEVLFTLQGHDGSINQIVFSPDGSRLASIAGGRRPSEGELKLWDAQTGEEILTFENVALGNVSFSLDGHRLFIAGRQGIKIFDATPLPEKP